MFYHYLYTLSYNLVAEMQAAVTIIFYISCCCAPASFSVHLPAVPSFRRGMSTHPGVITWYIYG